MLHHPPIITRAITDLSRRPYWSGLPHRDQVREVEKLARRLVLAESGIGQIAGLVSRKAAELADAYQLFLDSYPTREAAVGAAREALDRAGLSDAEEFGVEHFAETPEVLRHLLFCLLHLAFPALDHCDPPEEEAPQLAPSAVV